MKKIFISLIILSFSTFAFSQWIEKNSGTTDHLMSVYFTNTTTGFAVGNNGTILKTTDVGETWVAKNSSTTSWLMSVNFYGTNTGWACGAGGTILKTTDAGETWTSLTSGTTETLYSIFFSNINTGYACGTNGTIIKTTDGGTTWNTSNSGTTENLLSAHFIYLTTNGHIAGYEGTILRTSDGGTTWISQTSNTNETFNSICFANSALTAYAVGTNGIIKKTTNSGESWSTQTSGTTNHLRSVKFLDLNLGYAAGNNGVILKTENGGTNWILEETPSNTTIMSVFPYNADLVFAVGSGGMILKRTTALPGDAGTITGETTVCQGTTSVEYSVEAIPNAETYHWSLPAGTTGASTTNTILVDFGTDAVSGNISVYASNVNGDGASSILSVTVNEKPNTPVIMLSGYTLNSTIADAYQWYKDDIEITGATNQSYYVTENGDYYIIVSENGCFSDHSNVISVTHVSVAEINFSNIKIAPNPSSDKLVVTALEIKKIEIFDVCGNIVFSVDCNFADNCIIDVSGLAKGVYLIKTQTNYYKETKKIIVE